MQIICSFTEGYIWFLSVHIPGKLLVMLVEHVEEKDGTLVIWKDGLSVCKRGVLVVLGLLSCCWLSVQ